MLITSLLIIPAAAARRFARTPEAMAVLAALAGSLAVVLGLLGSLAWDTPSGPSIMVAAALIFALSLGSSGLRRRARTLYSAAAKGAYYARPESTWMSSRPRSPR